MKPYTDADIETVAGGIVREWGYDSLAEVDALPPEGDGVSEGVQARASAQAALDALAAAGRLLPHRPDYLKTSHEARPVTEPTPADHPHSDPGDGRPECDRCGKFVWPAIHSCKGVPVTAAARARHEVRKADVAKVTIAVGTNTRLAQATCEHADEAQALANCIYRISEASPSVRVSWIADAVHRVMRGDARD